MKSNLTNYLTLALAASIALFSASHVVAEDSPQATHEKTVAKAINFLRSKGQQPDGSFTPSTGPAVTALVVTAMLRNGVPAEDPVVQKALKHVEKYVREDGGIHQEGSLYRNYETSLAVLCFAEANKKGQYTKVIEKADKFVKGIQWAEDEDKDKSHPGYGGAGYGKHKRPDLSNTSFLVDALKAAGNDANSDAMKRALVFISRCQNLETEHNTTPHAAKNPDGGFYYTAAAGGSSQAGETPDGGLRSYGSMTYAGLKSMIYAGVKPDDPRVKAAVKWISAHYDLKSNPGMGQSGLYYYYHIFAKALDAVGQDQLEDADGKKHPWRQELTAELASRQQSDGSWVNDATRWLEGDPNLVTAYALMALSYTKPQAN